MAEPPAPLPVVSAAPNKPLAS